MIVSILYCWWSLIVFVCFCCFWLCLDVVMFIYFDGLRGWFWKGKVQALWFAGEGLALHTWKQCKDKLSQGLSRSRCTSFTFWWNDVCISMFFCSLGLFVLWPVLRLHFFVCTSSNYWRMREKDRDHVRRWSTMQLCYFFSDILFHSSFILN